MCTIIRDAITTGRISECAHEIVTTENTEDYKMLFSNFCIHLLHANLRWLSAMPLLAHIKQKRQKTMGFNSI